MSRLLHPQDRPKIFCLPARPSASSPQWEDLDNNAFVFNPRSHKRKWRQLTQPSSCCCMVDVLAAPHLQCVESSGCSTSLLRLLSWLVVSRQTSSHVLEVWLCVLCAPPRAGRPTCQLKDMLQSPSLACPGIDTFQRVPHNPTVAVAGNAVWVEK